MSDLIDRQAAIELVKDVCDAIMSGCESWYDPETEDEVYMDIREVDAILKCNKEVRIALRNMSSAQPERIRGRWIYTGVKFPNWEGQIVSEAICSECNGISYFRRAFDKYIGANICPNCGAEMEVTT